MNDDKYEILLKEGFFDKKRKINKEQKNKEKILNKVLYRNYQLDDNEKYISSNSIIKDCKNTKISSLVVGNNILEHITSLKCKFQTELDGFEYIDSSNLSKIKEGGFLRLVDLKENLKWGGMIIKFINKNNLSKFQIQLRNSKNNMWKIKFIKYFVFYKKNDPGAKFRDLFLSFADIDK